MSGRSVPGPGFSALGEATTLLFVEAPEAQGPGATTAHCRRKGCTINALPIHNCEQLQKPNKLADCAV